MKPAVEIKTCYCLMELTGWQRNYAITEWTQTEREPRQIQLVCLKSATRVTQDKFMQVSVSEYTDAYLLVLKGGEQRWHSAPVCCIWKPLHCATPVGRITTDAVVNSSAAQTEGKRRPSEDVHDSECWFCLLSSAIPSPSLSPSFSHDCP